MKRNLDICLGDAGNLLGGLRYETQGARQSAVFSYDPAWLLSPDSFAIDPNLPLVTGPQFHKKMPDGSAFPHALADTEPDGWGRRVILRDHAKKRQESRRRGEPKDTEPLNDLDFLLAVDDFSRVGALRLRDEQGLFQRAPEASGRTAPPLIELGHLLSATRAVETHQEQAADLEYLRGRGTSLGGMRPKCTVVDDDGSLSIGKFPSVGDQRAVTKGEVLAMRLAARAGIRVAQARLVMSDGLPVALIKRFDRTRNGDRLMYVSAATMLGVSPLDPQQHTYTEIVDALRVYGAAAQEDIRELWRRIAFSILITNVDDHLRNHGFLHVQGASWRLAPAFDLNPFPERQRELKTWISEDTGPDSTIDALMSVTPYFRLSNETAKTILAEVSAAVDHWRDEGRDLGMTHHELEHFEPAFEHEEQLVARRHAL